MASTEHGPGLAPPTFANRPRVLIVAAPFYRDIADNMIAGAQAALDAAGCSHELLEVPGALEIPTAIRLAEHNYNAFVALGCVIRGETTHYETVCNDSSRALTLLGIERKICLGNGILTVEKPGAGRRARRPKADEQRRRRGRSGTASSCHIPQVSQHVRC